MNLSNFFRAHPTKLHFFDGNISKNYYVYGVSKITSQENDKVEGELRSDEMMCIGGEEEFERIMSGDFNAFNRSDCALRFNEIFRWAWESWRAAVGTKIGAIYTNAIKIMNAGAKANGLYILRKKLLFINLKKIIFIPKKCHSLRK